MYEELLERLDRDGFAVVRDVLATDVVDNLSHLLDRLVDDDLAWRLEETERRREAGEADVRAFPRGGEGRFGFKLSDDDLRSELVSSVAAIVEAIGLPLRSGGGLGAFLPGWGGHEGLHQDLDGPAPAIGEWDGAIFTWPLSSGWDGMRLVPGSHRHDPVFREAFAGAIAPHPDEVIIDAAPGDVVINSIHVWKSVTLNRSIERRRDLWMSFSRDESVGQAIRDYWARTEITDGGAPIDPGNVVSAKADTVP